MPKLKPCFFLTNSKPQGFQNLSLFILAKFFRPLILKIIVIDLFHFYVVNIESEDKFEDRITGIRTPPNDLIIYCSEHLYFVIIHTNE